MKLQTFCVSRLKLWSYKLFVSHFWQPLNPFQQTQEFSDDNFPKEFFAGGGEIGSHGYAATKFLVSHLATFDPFTTNAKVFRWQFSERGKRVFSSGAIGKLSFIFMQLQSFESHIWQLLIFSTKAKVFRWQFFNRHKRVFCSRVYMKLQSFCVTHLATFDRQGFQTQKFCKLKNRIWTRKTNSNITPLVWKVTDWILPVRYYQNKIHRKMRYGDTLDRSDSVFSNASKPACPVFLPQK